MKNQRIIIPYSSQWIDRDDIRSVVSVLRSDFITQGPKVVEFEKRFAKIVGARYAVAVSSGTAALHISAFALGLKKGDEVITTPITFLATANAALYAGAKPVFADIDPLTLCIDPKEIEKKITRKTKAIFPVHFMGHPADLSAISRLAKKHGLFVLEDAAHALGAKYCGNSIGNCRYCDAAIFSFHPVKHITTGEGGMITTNSKAFYEKLCLLRNHGMTRDPKRLLKKNEGGWYYEMQELGFHYRMTDIQAALGISQLKKLKQFVSRRRAIARQYLQAFRGLEGISLPKEGSGCFNSYHLFVIRLESKKLRKTRKQIFEEMKTRGLGVQVHYIPIPSQPYYRRLGYRFSDFPAANMFYESAISLPIYPRMTASDIQYVINTVTSIVRDSLK